jgi:hypothetical protein
LEAEDEEADRPLKAAADSKQSVEAGLLDTSTELPLLCLLGDWTEDSALKVIVIVLPNKC